MAKAISPAVSGQALLQGAWLAIEQSGRLLKDAGSLYSLQSYSTAIAVAMFAREELGRHYILVDKWKEVAAGSSLTVEALHKAYDDHPAKQQRADLSTVYVGDRNSDIGKATLAQSQYPPGSPEFETAEIAIQAWFKRRRRQAPDERHQ